jgi:hypothetical protein
MKMARTHVGAKEHSRADKKRAAPCEAALKPKHYCLLDTCLEHQASG